MIFVVSCSNGSTGITEPIKIRPTETVTPVSTKTAEPTLKKPHVTVPTEVKSTVAPINTSTPEVKFESNPNTDKTIPPTNTTIPTPTQTPHTSVPKKQARKAETVPTPTAIPVYTPSPIVTPTPLDITTPEPLDRHMFTGPNFILTLNEEFSFDEIDYEITGLQNNEATTDQGVFKFEYSGSSVVLYWLPSLDITPEDLLAAAYQLLTNSQPENNFIIIGEGDLQLPNTAGKYGAFLISGEQSKESGGGLIGAWTCSINKTDFVVTVLSVDATVLQIRFDKLVNGFECTGES